MDSYYCGVHGEEMRKKFPTLEALRTEIERLGGTTEPAQHETKKTNNDLDIIDALNEADTDSGRLGLIQVLPITIRDVTELLELLETFDTDAGRNRALRLLAVAVKDRPNAILKIGAAYDTDAGRTLARSILSRP